MWEFRISIHSFQQVQDFVHLVCEQKFDVTVGNDYQIINGKDLMGMFCLDYGNPIRVRVRCSADEFSAFRKAALLAD